MAGMHVHLIDTPSAGQGLYIYTCILILGRRSTCRCILPLTIVVIRIRVSKSVLLDGLAPTPDLKSNVPEASSRAVSQLQPLLSASKGS